MVLNKRQKKAPLKPDPSLTLTLRRKAFAEITVRFNQISRLIDRTVIDNNALVLNAEPASSARFVYRYSSDKIAEFNSWLNGVIDEVIFDNLLYENADRLWLNKYIGAGYSKGATSAENILKHYVKDESNIPSLAAITAGLSIYANPAHVNRAQIIYGRNFTDLKGVTNEMARQISGVLAQGILEGKSPRELARKMRDRVDVIGKTRARLIARTEIVHAHHLAQIQEGDLIQANLGDDLEVKYKWNTCKDELVRPTHRARHNKVYTKKEALALIGEPNCRCGLIPVMVEI